MFLIFILALCEITNQCEEPIKKICVENTWKEAIPWFIYDLWQFKCMEELFIITNHSIEIHDGELQSKGCVARTNARILCSVIF